MQKIWLYAVQRTNNFRDGRIQINFTNKNFDLAKFLYYFLVWNTINKCKIFNLHEILLFQERKK